jgi:hypothetical protein
MGLLRTWFGWLTMNIPLPLEEATGLTIHAPAEHQRGSNGCNGKVFLKFEQFLEVANLCRVLINCHTEYTE